MKYSLLIKTIKYSAISLFSLIILIISALFIIGVYYKDEVSAIVISELNKNIDTEVNVESVEFSLFSKFPGASLEFKNITIKSSKNIKKSDFQKINPDTLLFAKSLFLEFNVIDIFKKNYIIKKIYIEKGRLNILYDSNDENNFNLWKTKTENEANIQLNLNDLRLKNTTINYRNLVKDILWKSNFFSLNLAGNFGTDNYYIDSDFDAFVNSCTIDGIDFINNRNLKSELIINVNKDTYSINKGELNISGMNLNTKGNIIYSDETKIDLVFSGNNLNIKSFIGILPEKFTKNILEYNSNGNFYFESRINGIFNKNHNPHIDIKFGVKNGKIYNPKNKLELTNISLTGLFSNGKYNSSSTSFFKFENFNAKLGNSSFSGNLFIENFLSPNIQLSSNLNVDLKELDKFVKLDSVEKIDGILISNIKYSGKYNDFKNLTEADICNSLIEGNIDLSDFNYKKLNNKIEIQNCNAIANFYNNNLSIEKLKFEIGNNDFSFNGNLKYILSYLLLENKKLLLTGDIVSERLNYNDFTTDSFSSNNTLFPENIGINANLQITELKIEKFVASNLKSQLFIDNNKLIAKYLSFNSLKGFASGDAILEIKTNNDLLFQCSANIKDVDIKSLFSTFDNFGQDFIMDKHLIGKITATIDYSSLWDKDFNIIPSSVLCESKIEISNGELNNFEPLKRLSKFIELSELENIKFSTLKNEIFIKNKIINIPQMDINSSAFNIQVAGNHTFENKFDYRLKVLLSEVLTKKAKSKKKENEEFLVEDDGLGRTSLFLLISGTPENYKITYDSKKVKENIKENLKIEKQTLKKILNEEFGWFKNDSTIINKKIEDKKIDFNTQKVNISWDEEKPEKNKFDDD